MRLRSVWISAYKNLNNFSITFEGDDFIDIFVGKNGSGKSNFLEALIEIFDHVHSPRAGDTGPRFDYEILYEIDGTEVQLAWRGGDFVVNGEGGRQTLGQTRAPDHILVYYSGQNDQVLRLVNRYEGRFRIQLRNADGPIAPQIIGIGPACKKLLIVTMLMLPEESVARQILCQKLAILNCRRSIDLTLSKPFFVQRPDHDPLDPEQLFWGVTGYIRSFLQNVIDSIEGEFTPGQLYDREAGLYRLTCNIDRLREALGDESGLSLFRSLEALRVLGMLSDIQLPFALQGLEVSGLDLFSDGQFQSVYLFGIAEIFKELNCVALLDEPDAFLHPEWQFAFLKQVNAISAGAAAHNHMLLSSHSASTIAADAPSRIRMFVAGENGVELFEQDKAQLVKSLSAGLITFSEREAKLEIQSVLANTDGPILFTEGISDVLILTAAWERLYPGVACPFAIEQAFGSGFLRNLLRMQSLYDANPQRRFFGLFDFDQAYADWAQLGESIEENPSRCLTRKRQNAEGYALLLPIDPTLPLRAQAIRPDGRSYGDASRLTIELLFYGIPGLEDHFQADVSEIGQPIKFSGDKVQFAQTVVPSLAANRFEVLSPIFDFVRSKI